MADDLDHAMARLEELQLHYERRFVKAMRAIGGRVEAEGLARLEAMPRRTGTAEYEEFVRQQLADYPRLHAERQVSRFELPSTAGTLVRLQGLIEDTHDTARWPGPRPLIGTVHSGRVNAMAVAIDSPAYYLVLIESGVFGFANLFAKAISRAFPLDPGTDGRPAGHSADPRRAIACINADDAQGEELRHRFLDLLLAYAVHGDPHHAAPYFNEPEREFLHAGLLDGMELFVLAHERGHAFMNHFERAGTRPLPDGGEASEYLSSWQQEFEADGFGLTIAAGALARFGFDPAFAFAACCSFLAGMEVLLRTVDMLDTGAVAEHGTPTHPPPGMRAQMLRDYVVGTTGIGPEDGYFATCKALLDVIEAYWRAAVPGLTALHHAGVRATSLSRS